MVLKLTFLFLSGKLLHFSSSKNCFLTLAHSTTREHSLDIRNPYSSHNRVEMATLVLNEVLLRSHLRLQGVQGITSTFTFILISPFLVGLRDRLGYVAGVITVLVTDSDFDMICISNLLGLQNRFELEHRHIPVESIPAGGQIELLNNPEQGLLRLDNFKLVLYVCVRRRSPCHWLTDGPIERIQFDKGMVNLQERSAFVFLRQDVSDYGRRHENKKECQEDDAIAIFQDLPVINRVECGFAGICLAFGSVSHIFRVSIN